uniref:DNA2/NAM7 helicase helicase domain-containing protein n=1 Tax=Lutzomyia longipalpis TaxID=7200 RepID=A0A1B0C9U1_LUTLO
MLKNLAMGGGEEKRSIPTNAPAKIKLTWENRGNFLTEVLPKKPIPTRRQSLDAALLAADSVYAAPKKIKDRRKTINTADDHVARNELDQNEGNDDIDVDLGILPEFSGDFPASYGTHIRHKKRIAHTPKYVEPSVQEESVEAAESNRVSTIKFAEPLEAIFELCPSPVPEEVPTDAPYLTLNCVKDEVTKWNPLWLKHNNYSKMDLINPSTALLRIGKTFDSFSSYLDTMIPLMMLELWAQIMKQVHIPQGQQTERLLLNIASVTRNGGRFVIKTQNITGKPPNIQIGDLVVLECQYQRRIQKFFVHTKNIEPDGREVTFETAFLNLDSSIENTLAHVEPIMNITYVLMEFEYVFNLENSPLYRTILDSTMLRHEDEDVSQKKANAHFEYCGRDALNPTQMTTIEKVSAQCLNPRGTISLIQGGPGTGKSRIIANLVFQLLLHHNQLFPDMKILVCARSNAAVDYLAAQMMDIKRELNKNFHIVRFGVESRFSANVKCISHEEHARAYKQGMISVKDNPEYRKLYEVKV